MSAAFLRERERLMSEIAESLGRLGSNLNSLNRNLESVNEVGSQFAPVATLWQQLQEGIGASEEPVERKADQMEGAARAAPNLGIAVAPGGGTNRA